VVLSLFVFIADGLLCVDQPRYYPFFTRGFGGLLEATGFVFVSYAGVTKIASVAEEIEDPGWNIPLEILGSVVAMMLVYTFTIFVVVGVAPPEPLTTTLTPMALAAVSFMGEMGDILVAAVAVLALTSMANAGVLSSRFPLAMSRDNLAPAAFGAIHERLQTPVYAILFTGALLLVLIAFVPVIELAKLASVFKILVFALVNAALIAFRESDLEWYDPEFVAPDYPWLQLGGVLAGAVLAHAAASIRAPALPPRSVRLPVLSPPPRRQSRPRDAPAGPGAADRHPPVLRVQRRHHLSPAGRAGRARVPRAHPVGVAGPILGFDSVVVCRSAVGRPSPIPIPDSLSAPLRTLAAAVEGVDPPRVGFRLPGYRVRKFVSFRLDSAASEQTGSGRFRPRSVPLPRESANRRPTDRRV
jgi:amino acid transporter